MRFAVIAAGFTLCSALVSGCHSQPVQGGVTQDQKAQMQVQQTAIKAVKVFDSMPQGATPIRKVLAATCSLGVGAKDDAEYVTVGLKLKAYQLGATGITNVDVTVLQDTSGHCQFGGVGGSALAFKLGAN
ncbi:hypothetical protein [Pseudomonas asplenii]|uniref:hypothetical protein n=1 Tax=Pseudomonas asplenii TaxID=53407 RepID=UPI0006B3FD7B|nr:hypothetical protein [Pseudomonas fuscovaginae]